MRKLTIIEHISLDGIIQAPGGPDEDRDGDFQQGGWSARYSDPMIRELIVAAHSNAFDLLLGRRTYDIWSGHWPKAKGGPFADRFNAATKYVATHRSSSCQIVPKARTISVGRRQAFHKVTRENLKLIAIRST
jgi:dihydrofolate reductase